MRENVRTQWTRLYNVCAGLVEPDKKTNAANAASDPPAADPPVAGATTVGSANAETLPALTAAPFATPPADASACQTPHAASPAGAGGAAAEALSTDNLQTPNPIATTTTAASAAAVTAPAANTPNFAVDLTSWFGSWEGHFVLRRNGKDTEIRERFVLQPSSAEHSPEDDVIRVAGGGTNTYGRFQLYGTFNTATQALDCERAYVQMPRKRRRRTAPTAPDASASRVSQRYREVGRRACSILHTASNITYVPICTLCVPGRWIN